MILCVIVLLVQSIAWLWLLILSVYCLACQVRNVWLWLFFVLLVSQECLALVVDFMCFCLARQVKSGVTQGSPRYFVRFVHFGAVCLHIHSVSLPVFCVNC